VQKKKTLREKLNSKLLEKSDIPVIVFLTVVFSLFIVWRMRKYSPDLSLNLFSELVGVAFTLFIIDTLLVRSKNKLWEIVHVDIDYLISRNINRLRDGIATRVFSFEADVDFSNQDYNQNAKNLSTKRAEFLNELENLSEEEVLSRLNEEVFFTEDNYDYFDEKAEDIWEVINMKYSEYLAPELVSQLIDLHTSLKDLGSSIRQYEKSEFLKAHREYYQNAGKQSAAAHLIDLIEILNDLKEAGYSELARD
jgi:hypothetical protein